MRRLNATLMEEWKEDRKAFERTIDVLAQQRNDWQMRCECASAELARRVQAENEVQAELTEQKRQNAEMLLANEEWGKQCAQLTTRIQDIHQQYAEQIRILTESLARKLVP